MFGFSSVSTSGVASTSSPHIDPCKRGIGETGAELREEGESHEMENKTPPTIPAKRSTSLIYQGIQFGTFTFSGISRMADFLYISRNCWLENDAKKSLNFYAIM